MTAQLLSNVQDCDFIGLLLFYVIAMHIFTTFGMLAFCDLDHHCASRCHSTWQSQAINKHNANCEIRHNTQNYFDYHDSDFWLHFHQPCHFPQSPKKLWFIFVIMDDKTAWVPLNLCPSAVTKLSVAWDERLAGDHGTYNFSCTIKIQWKKIFCCNPFAGHEIATKLCTCHDSTAVMTSEKFCGDQYVTICIIFIKFEL